MKSIAILMAMLPMYAQAATCYGSADCQHQMNAQIEEANRKQLEEIKRRNEQIEQERRMQEMIEQSKSYK